MGVKDKIIDTIFAKASGGGVAGVAVVRISGPGAGAALETLSKKTLPQARLATVRRIYSPDVNDALDDALVLWFPAPASFTGDDVCELHLHGGVAVVSGVLAALAKMDGLRPAEAGEFTRRAFLNNKLDLTQVEGLADLVAAETEAQRRQALVQAEGGLGKVYDGWRERLVHVLALVEAALDFSDEELPDDITDGAIATCAKVMEEIQSHLKDGRKGERLRTGVRMAIIGAPNAGKSSMINALAMRDAAIVSDIAGTTRDVVEVHLNLGGYPLLVADPAGLRGEGNNTNDTIELEGVRRARAWAAGADLKLCMFDGSALPQLDGETAALINEDAVVCVNKSDMLGAKLPQNISDREVLSVSVKTGDGMDRLLGHIEKRLAELLEVSGDAPLPTRERHRHALAECSCALVRFINDEKTGVDELAAEDLRLAVRALGRITGRVDVEELLDIIFSEFCIGK